VSAWWDRAPEIVALAHDGDAVARLLLDRQGEEIGLLAASLLARLDLGETPVPVVLGGGIGATGDPLLVSAAERTLAARVPKASLSVVTERPIVGAAHLALETARRL
jgi:predicted NBD/HSP70 family sugar kinase